MNGQQKTQKTTDIVKGIIAENAGSHTMKIAKLRQTPKLPSKIIEENQLSTMITTFMLTGMHYFF